LSSIASLQLLDAIQSWLVDCGAFSTMDRKRSKKAKVGKPRQNSQNPIEAIPPLIKSNPINRSIRRYRQAQAMAGVAYTLADGHSAFLVVTDVAGNAKCWADMWRIRWIKFWYEDLTGSGRSLQVAIQTVDPTNMNCSPERNYAITARSTAEPGKLKIKPQKGDPLEGWKETSTVNVATTIFTCTVTEAQSITMDICFDFVPNIIGGPNGFTALTSTVVTGSMGATSIMGGGFNPQGINSL